MGTTLRRNPPRRRSRGPLRAPFLVALASVAVASACGTASRAPAPAAPAGAPSLPPVPEVRGALAIDVVHPPAGETVPAVDSTFVFGSVGSGDATLEVNGVPVPVAANGAWIAFLPLPRDGRYELVARLDGRSDTVMHQVEVARPEPIEAVVGRLGIVPGSIRPLGPVTVVQGERLEASVRATPGAEVALLLPGGTRVPLTEEPAAERHVGFALDRTVPQEGVSRYSGLFRAEAPLFHPAADGDGETPALAPEGCRNAEGTGASDPALLELTLGGDTLRVPFPTCIAVLAPAELRAATVDTDRPDSMAVGRLAPGGDQAWEYFWWSGTPLALDGEVPGYFRVRLAEDLHAWISRGDVVLGPGASPPPRGEVGPAIELEPTDDGVEIRFHGTDLGPYRVEPSERGLGVEFYGATGRPAFVGHGAGEGFVDRVHWDQVTDERFRFQVDLHEPLWGFRHHRDARGRLVVELRRPPRVDPEDPFRGLLIAVDAGHPPGGAVGPTRLKEAEVTLPVSRRLVRLLEERGARVVEVRPDTATLGLFDRVMAVQESGADLSVSVHFNAFPDGVDPFPNNGTAVFYFWPQAVPLARHLQRALVAELGLRDVGIRFQNLAMARIGWMPAVLTESLFMMIPLQEAALRDETVLQRIAEAHVRGLERFLTEAGRGRTDADTPP